MLAGQGCRCFGGSCCIHLLAQVTVRSMYFQDVRYCLLYSTVSHLRRQNVIMMQVSVADYSHVGYDTALIGNLLPIY